MSGTAGAPNPQVRNRIRPSAQVAKAGPRTLSRWRHGFEPRWDYARQTLFPGVASAGGVALPPGVHEPSRLGIVASTYRAGLSRSRSPSSGVAVEDGGASPGHDCPRDRSPRRGRATCSDRRDALRSGQSLGRGRPSEGSCPSRDSHGLCADLRQPGGSAPGRRSRWRRRIYVCAGRSHGVNRR
jgi:hypothetical protein